MSESKKIFELIPKVMGEIGAIEKTGVNKDQNYKFRRVDDIYSNCQPIMAKHGIFILPEVLTSSEERYQTKSGANQVRVKLRVKYTVAAYDGSSVATIVDAEGVDSSDKATNKALTAAFKYMMIQVFCLAVEDAVDADSESPEAPSKQANAKFSEYIVTFGKFKGLPLAKCTRTDLEQYVEYVELSINQNGKEPTAQVAEFLVEAKKYLGGTK